MINIPKLASMKLSFGSIVDYLFILPVKRVIMLLDCQHILVISLTINGLILLCCAIVKFGKILTEKCCVRKDNLLAKMFQNYDDKPWLLAKILTEQVITCLLCVMALAAVCSREVIEFPFTKNGEKSLFISTIFKMIIGKYIFCISAEIMLQGHFGSVRFKISMIHNSVTLVCYMVFVSYQQNILLGLIGAMMEVNNITIEILRTLKEIGSVETTQYRQISVVNCILAITFRGVVPIVFLIIAMFHEKPFKMEYGPLTTFFLSLIFFSVISVWLVLSSVRRVINMFIVRKDDSCSQSQRESRFPDNFQKNNLDYLHKCDNINVSDISEVEKNNYSNRKKFPKVNIETACAVFGQTTAYQLSTDIEHTTRDMETSENRTLDSPPSLRPVVVRYSTENHELSSSERSNSSGLSSSERSNSSGTILLDNHSVINDISFQSLTYRTEIQNNFNHLSQDLTLEQDSTSDNSGIAGSDSRPYSNEEAV